MEEQSFAKSPCITFVSLYSRFNMFNGIFFDLVAPLLFVDPVSLLH